MEEHEFKKELEQLKGAEILTPEYKRKKMILYGIRTSIAAILYVVFWKHEWVRWTLLLYIPLNLFGLWMILYGTKKLKQKQEKVLSDLEGLE